MREGTIAIYSTSALTKTHRHKAMGCLTASLDWLIYDVNLTTNKLDSYIIQSQSQYHITFILYYISLLLALFNFHYCTLLLYIKNEMHYTEKRGC